MAPCFNPSSQPSGASISAKEAIDTACRSLKTYYLDEHAHLLAKIKMTQLIRNANSLPPQFETAWTAIQNRSKTQADAIAALTLQLQRLLTAGQTSEFG